jgi:hypothetical protein
MLIAVAVFGEKFHLLSDGQIQWGGASLDKRELPFG